MKAVVAHGLGNVSAVLDKVRDAREKGTSSPYHFIEVMACPGGCIAGGGQPGRISNSIREARIKGLYDDDKDLRVMRCSHDNPYIKMLYDNYLGEPLGGKAEELLHTKYVARPQYHK